MSSKQYFEKISRLQDSRINLAEAALHIATEEYPEMDIRAYLDQLEKWADALRKKSLRKRVPAKIDQLHELLFDRMQFTGNIDNYYDPRNSFLNDVIDRRTGIPITLSIIYLELAWSVGLKAAGIGFPGHFLVQLTDRDMPFYIDVFRKGRILTIDDCKDFWEDLTEGELEFQPAFLASIPKRQMLTRMLHNLKSIYLEQKSYKKLLPVLDKLIILNPDIPEEIRDRGIVLYQMQAYRSALQDFQTYLSISSHSEESEMIQQYVQILQEYSTHLN